MSARKQKALETLEVIRGQRRPKWSTNSIQRNRAIKAITLLIAWYLRVSSVERPI